MKIYFIYVTFGSLKEAKRLGGELVKNKLAACTNIIPTIYSTYVWKNKTMTDKECSMIIKTSESKVKKAMRFVIKIECAICMNKTHARTRIHNKTQSLITLKFI